MADIKIAIINRSSVVSDADVLPVGAELKLSHCADSIMSQGWKPNLLGSAVDKCRVLSASLSSFVVYLVVDSEFVRG